LCGGKFIEIGIGEAACGALGALADADVAKLARGDVLAQGLDGDAEISRGLLRRAKPARDRGARLAAAATWNGERPIGGTDAVELLVVAGEQGRDAFCGHRRVIALPVKRPRPS
jgi:hypothetical protein